MCLGFFRVWGSGGLWARGLGLALQTSNQTCAASCLPKDKATGILNPKPTILEPQTLNPGPRTLLGGSWVVIK